MADVFNKEPVEFVDLNDLFPVLNSAVGLTYEQFRILVENTFWLKNQEEIGVVKAFIVSGSSEFGSLWLSETDGGAPLIPNAEYIYIVQTNGNFKNKLFSWNGSVYEQLAKDSDNNYTNADKSKVDKIIIDGNGTRFLANDGLYKAVSGGGGGIQSRIQNSDNTRFVDTEASEVAIDLRPSLSQGGGSESGRIKLARNFFELYAEKIHTNPNLKYIYHLITKDNGSIEIVVEDSDEIYGKGKETYSFDFVGEDNPNQVAKILDIPKVVSATDVVVAVEDWIADTTYTDYGYKAVLTLTGMLSTYEPSVVFGLVEVETGNYASVCLAGTDTITIYAKEIPSASITLPLIKGEQL